MNLMIKQILFTLNMIIIMYIIYQIYKMCKIKYLVKYLLRQYDTLNNFLKCDDLTYEEEVMIYESKEMIEEKLNQIQNDFYNN